MLTSHKEKTLASFSSLMAPLFAAALSVSPFGDNSHTDEYGITPKAKQILSDISGDSEFSHDETHLGYDDKGDFYSSFTTKNAVEGFNSIQVIYIPHNGGYSPANMTKCFFSDAAREKMDGMVRTLNSIGAYAESLSPDKARADIDHSIPLCDEGRPKIVMSVDINNEDETYTPWGIAVFDGDTGETSVYENVDEAQLPGELKLY